MVGTVAQQDDGRKERDTDKGTHTLEQYTQFLLANRSPDLMEKKSCDAKFIISFIPRLSPYCKWWKAGRNETRFPYLNRQAPLVFTDSCLTLVQNFCVQS